MEPQKQNGKRKPHKVVPWALNPVTTMLRISPMLHSRLKAACKASGRSQNSEIIHHIERSLWLDDMLKARLISVRVPAGKTEGRE